MGGAGHWPATRYVAVGDADVAYQIVGNGPIDLLYCYGLGGHVEFMWDMPSGVVFLDRLASLFRLIVFDRRAICERPDRLRVQVVNATLRRVLVMVISIRGFVEVFR